MLHVKLYHYEPTMDCFRGNTKNTLHFKCDFKKCNKLFLATLSVYIRDKKSQVMCLTLKWCLSLKLGE